MKTMVTGCAGFIGFHLSKYLLSRGDSVVGFDNLNSLTYDNKIKFDRLKILEDYEKFDFTRGDLRSQSDLDPVFDNHFDTVCHLAANAGVRNSIDFPVEYVASNVLGFTQIIEHCKRCEIDNFVYASSSSVYGINNARPSNESMGLRQPASLYAATKIANELIAFSYNHLFGMKTTGLRFFTVYGPWGRPDMALLIFTRNILDEVPIQVFDRGNMFRDFTYVDDIVCGIAKCIDNPSECEIFNVDNGRPENLMDFVQLIEDCCGKKAKIELSPMQPGDIKGSHADIAHINKVHGYKPTTDISIGIPKTIEWIKEYYDYD